ncbi:MAG TPA: HEPN domain-containing protein [Chloroflexota bacterium]|nr:HEPN domain-containing protein [Chloroflexota bacterium]
MAETTTPAGREAARWLKQSDHDLADAQLVAGAGRHALACFLAHQAAEKAVTAYLLLRGAEQVWGHALADLCEDAMALDPSFDFIKSVAGLLDKYYLGTRYPSALPGGVPAEAFEGHDSERALEIARDVQQFVRGRLADLASAPRAPQAD